MPVPAVDSDRLETGCYSIEDLMFLMTEKMQETVSALDKNEVIQLFNELLAAGRVYVAGAGRSGLVAKAFAMRLMHIGYDSYVIGETITPAFSSGDTLIVFSGSGETNSIYDVCETARDLGGHICLITATKKSRMAALSTCRVVFGSIESGSEISSQYEIRQITGQYRSVTSSFAPLGTLFETAALIFSDAIISALIEARHCNLDEVRGRLSRLQ
jgi:6-phospho-3-hexuloisomerase